MPSGGTTPSGAHFPRCLFLSIHLGCALRGSGLVWTPPFPGTSVNFPPIRRKHHFLDQSKHRPNHYYSSDQSQCCATSLKKVGHPPLWPPYKTPGFWVKGISGSAANQPVKNSKQSVFFKGKHNFMLGFLVLPLVCFYVTAFRVQFAFTSVGHIFSLRHLSFFSWFQFPFTRVGHLE